MNKLLLSTCLALFALTAHGRKTKTMEQPAWLLSNTGSSLTVTKVEFTDTATVVSFHSEYKPNEWIRIARASTLTGDDGKKYAARHGIGITLAKRFYMPPSGKTDFKVSFEPMPHTTRFIDFTEGPDGWTIWGIHDSGTPLPKPKKTKAGRQGITDESTFFRRGTGVVRGRFTGKHPNTITYLGSNSMTQEDLPQVFDVADDGTFTATIPVNHPSISYLMDDRTIYYFYTEAGDTLDITINDKGKVTYPETAGYTRLLNIMSRRGGSPALEYSKVKAVADSMPMSGYDKWMESKVDSMLATTDYIAGRCGLSPRETHLLRTYVLMRHIITFYGCIRNEMDKEQLDTDNYSTVRRLPVEDLSCLIFTGNMSTLLNRYEYSSPIFRQYDGERITIGTDSTAMAADRALFGTGPHPSILLQMTWLNKNRYKNQFEHRPDETLKEMDRRRNIVTSPFVRSLLDEMKDELTAPKTMAYGLPEGKATDVLRAITDRYRGKFVYIDFWGIYCAPCRANIERTQELRDSIATLPDVEMVFITGERYSPQKQYDEYVAKKLRGEECYRLSQDDYNRLMALFRFNGIPHYELMAPDGRIIPVNVREHLYRNFGQFKDNIRKMKEQLGTE